MVNDIPYIRELFDRCFLHDGHIGSASSFLPCAGVDSLPLPLKNVNLTGIRFFRLGTISKQYPRRKSVFYTRDRMGRVSTTTGCLQFDISQGSRRASGCICRRQRWQPEIGQFMF
jgi:hypothetical protein